MVDTSLLRENIILYILCTGHDLYHNLFWYIIRLKKSKEYERIKLEEESHHSIEPTDPLTGRTADECEEQELTGREMAMLSIGERKRQASKQRDVKRWFVELNCIV